MASSFALSVAETMMTVWQLRISRRVLNGGTRSPLYLRSKIRTILDYYSKLFRARSQGREEAGFISPCEKGIPITVANESRVVRREPNSDWTPGGEVLYGSTHKNSYSTISDAFSITDSMASTRCRTLELSMRMRFTSRCWYTVPMTTMSVTAPSSS